jgi:hypothetical protein
MDFRTIANLAFDDLLLLREAVVLRRGALAKDCHRAVEHVAIAPDTLPACQDTLVRLEVMTRAEAIARTQDLDCHLLTVFDPTNPGI